MTSIEDYRKTLAGRLERMLGAVDQESLTNEDTTMIILVATQAIVVPWDRFKNKQPPEGTSRFWKSLERMNELKRTPFLKCHLWPYSSRTWRIRSQVGQALDQYADRPMYGLRCSQVIFHLRNSLLSGSIGILNQTQPSEIIFYHRSHRSALVVTVSDFLLFLRNWLRFVNSLSLD